MKVSTYLLCLAFPAAIGCSLTASPLTPLDIGAPFAVQPFVGLTVNSGMTDLFFSNLAGLGITRPIVTVLGDLRGFDAGGTPAPAFQVLGVTVIQNGSSTPPLSPFLVSSPTTYTSTLNPSSHVTIRPGELNLAFTFVSDPSLQYFYKLSVSGVPNGGFVLLNDVEGTLVPEPGSGWLVTVLLPAILIVKAARYKRGE
jgi:hypothetical protein